MIVWAEVGQNISVAKIRSNESSTHEDFCTAKLPAVRLQTSNLISNKNSDLISKRQAWGVKLPVTILLDSH